MSDNAYLRLAERFNVHPTTARGWIYRGLIGRKRPKLKRKYASAGRPDEHIVTNEDIENFVPPRNKLRQEESRILHASGLSNSVIANAMGVSHTTIQNWIKGMISPAEKKQMESLKTLRDESRVAVASAMQATGSKPSEIAEALGVPVSHVYGWRGKGLLD